MTFLKCLERIRFDSPSFNLKISKYVIEKMLFCLFLRSQVAVRGKTLELENRSDAYGMSLLPVNISIFKLTKKKIKIIPKPNHFLMPQRYEVPTSQPRSSNGRTE